MMSSTLGHPGTRPLSRERSCGPGPVWGGGRRVAGLTLTNGGRKRNGIRCVRSTVMRSPSRTLHACWNVRSLVGCSATMSYESSTLRALFCPHIDPVV
jgi:hypothetical protein